MVPAASRRSHPCCPAIGSLRVGNSLSALVIARPVTRASAPLNSCASFGNAPASSSSMRTASGTLASSASVPSISRNSAQSLASGGGGGRTKREGRGVSRSSSVVSMISKSGCLGLRLLVETLAMAHRRRIEQHAPGPPVHVEFADDVAHEPHAVALFFLGHGERDAERARALLGIVRIDNEGFGEFARGTGKLRQDEHAALVVVRCNVLLGDQVHAVVQAAHHA